MLVSGRNHSFYQAPIGYVANQNRTNEMNSFVPAEVQAGALGIGVIFLLCEA